MHLKPKPAWLKRRLPKGAGYENIRALLKKGQLHTVCQEANCPNIWECFSSGTATFLILGSRCTRSCGFCAVAKHPQGQPDPEEPLRVAEAAKTLNLDYVVVTSVTRDDLPDGGANHFDATIRQLRSKLPQAQIEVLIPDFQGSQPALKTVLEAAPDILNHNIETVPRLYPLVRPQADYRQSLTLLARSRQMTPDIPTKSGLIVVLLMLGNSKKLQQCHVIYPFGQRTDQKHRRLSANLRGRNGTVRVESCRDGHFLKQ